MSVAGNIRAGAAYVELTLNDSVLSRGLRRAQARLKAFSASVSQMGQSMMRMSAVATAPLALSARTFMGFSDQMAEVRAVTGAAGDAFIAMSEKAKELGRTTSFTAKQVSEGMTELGRAGFKSEQILASIPSVLNLARGTATDLGRAAEIAAAAMRGFGLEAEDTTRISDVLVATANNSAQSLNDIGEALKYVAPLAMEAGETLEDTAAAIGVMANNGIKGSQAGTALARAYKNLSTAPAQKMLRDLGVEAVDQAGNLRNVASILSELGESTAHMGSAEKLATFETLFGRGQAAALKLAAPGADFSDLQQTLLSARGTAEETAKTMDDTLGGSFRMLSSAIEGVQIAIGEALEGTLRVWMDRFADIAGEVTRLVRANQSLIVGFLKVAVIVGVAGAALVALGAAGGALSMVLGGIASVVSLVGAGIGMLGTALAALVSPIGLTVVALGALGAYLLHVTGVGAKALQWLSRQFENLRDRALASYKGIGDAMAAGDISLAVKILWLAIKVEWHRGLNVLREYWIGFKEFFVSAFTDAVYGTLAIGQRLWAGILRGLERVRAGWHTVVNEVTAIWTGLQNRIEGAATRVLIERDFQARIKRLDAAVKSGRMREDVAEGQKAMLREQHQINMGDTYAMQERQAREIEERRATEEERIGKSYDDAIAQTNEGLERSLIAISQAANQEHAERRAQYASEMQAGEDALDQARREWQEAIQAAGDARVAKETEEDAPERLEKADDALGSLVDRLRYAGEAMEETVQRSTETKGTFNASVMQGFLSGGAQERTAKAAEETAKNTKRLLHLVEDGDGLVFG